MPLPLFVYLWNRQLFVYWRTAGVMGANNGDRLLLSASLCLNSTPYNQIKELVLWDSEGMTALTLPLKVDLKDVHFTDEQFYQLCVNNPELNVERDSKGTLIVMAPVGGDSGNREADYITDLNIWNRQSGLGKVFSSSTLFKLPGGGDRSPDAAWVKLSRWQVLTSEQRQKFPPIAPDFVIELRSRTDSLKSL